MQYWGAGAGLNEGTDAQALASRVAELDLDRVPRQACSAQSNPFQCHVTLPTPFSATSLFQPLQRRRAPRVAPGEGRGGPPARATRRPPPLGCSGGGAHACDGRPGRQRRADDSMRGCADGCRKQPRPGRGCTVRMDSPVAIEEERHPIGAARREHRRDLARQEPASAYAAPPASPPPRPPLSCTNWTRLVLLPVLTGRVSSFPPRMRLADPPPAWQPQAARRRSARQRAQVRARRRRTRQWIQG